MKRESARKRYSGANLTDLGNSTRFVKRYAKRVRYVPKWGVWLMWDGTRWRRDDVGEVDRLAWDTVLAIYDEVKKAKSRGERDELAAHARRSESEQRIRAMLNLASKHESIVVCHDELDRSPWLLNVANGTVDLRTGTLRSHDPRDLITKLVPTTYDAGATCPLWKRFLKDIMADRAAMIAFLQRAVGYSLCGITTEDCFFFLQGGGGNGKTTFLNVVRAELGDYAVAANIETFLVRRNASSTSGDVARMEGARLVSASEPARGARWDEGRIKQLTGGDAVTASFKYQEEFEFIPVCKLWFAANHKPRLMDTSRAMKRRLRLVPFTVTITAEDRDLEEKLRAELPGILAWSVRGCIAWQKEGLGVPPDVRVASDEYLAESDTVGAFLESCCVPLSTGVVPAKALYERYCAWARETGERPTTTTELGRELADRGLERDKKGHGNTVQWLGIALREPAERSSEEGSEGLRGSFQESFRNSSHKGVSRNSPLKPSEPSSNGDRGEAWEPDEPVDTGWPGAA